MNESTWQEAETASGFYGIAHGYQQSKVNTEVKMSYDNENIYIIAICRLPKKGPFMVESLRRDFVFGKNDNFIFFWTLTMILPMVIRSGRMRPVRNGMVCCMKEVKRILTGTINGCRL
jgi:hypothetical protein